MKYFKRYKNKEVNEHFEVTEEQARLTLEGYWKEDFLDDIFKNKKQFRLYTPFAYIWTVENGMMPMPGFFGVCE